MLLIPVTPNSSLLLITVLLLQSWTLSEHGDAKTQATRLAAAGPTGETGGYVGEKMLTFTNGGRFALARMLGAGKGEPSTITPANDGKPLVLQYEVRAQTPIGCGGGYLKIAGVPAAAADGEANANEDKDENNASLVIGAQTDLSDPKLYSVMFGPDKCGGSNKIHLIVRHRNPVTGETNEHHMVQPVTGKAVWTSAASSQHFRLVIRPDDTFLLAVNGETVKDGAMLADGTFEPPFEPAKTISDPTETKPADWVDEAKIPDPEDTKPADWVDDATIPDPEASKPEDWDDEEDGEWEAPLVANEEFSGEWTAKMIDNPEYKGEWKPKDIPNPAHYTPEKGSISKGIKATGIILEVIAHASNLAFDNVYLGTNEEEAVTFADAEWLPRFEAQEAAIEAAAEAKRKAADDASDKELDALLLEDSILSKCSWVMQKGMRIAGRNPLIATIGGATILAVLAFLVVACCGGSGGGGDGRGHSHSHGDHGHSHGGGGEPEVVRVPEGVVGEEDEDEDEAEQAEAAGDEG